MILKTAARVQGPFFPALLTVCLLSGCAIRSRSTIEATGDFGATPAGPSAVLQVSTRSVGTPKTGRATWGAVDTMNADQRFAELLAHAAAEEGGMSVLHPLTAAERLQAAGLEPTLQPDEEELEKRAEILGSASYLTAHVSRWRYSYVFFASSAVIEFRLACRVPGGDKPVWEVEVCRTAPGMSDGEVALLALRETFRWLKEHTSGGIR